MKKERPVQKNILDILLVDLDLSLELKQKLTRAKSIELRGKNSNEKLNIPGTKVTVENFIYWHVRNGQEFSMHSCWNIFEERDITDLRQALKKHGADLKELFKAQKAVSESQARELQEIAE